MSTNWQSKFVLIILFFENIAKIAYVAFGVVSRSLRSNINKFYLKHFFLLLKTKELFRWPILSFSLYIYYIINISVITPISFLRFIRLIVINAYTHFTASFYAFINGEVVLIQHDSKQSWNREQTRNIGEVL